MNYFKKKLAQIEQLKQQQGDQGTQGALGGEVGGSFSEAQSTGGTGASFASQIEGGLGEMGQGFGERTKAFSRTLQADDPNRQSMRKDYGWKMTNRQYDALQKDKSKFDSSIRDYKKQYNTRIGEAKAKGQSQIAAEEQRYGKFKESFAQEYQTNKGKFDAARKKLGSLPTKDSLFNKFWQDRKMRVTVWDGAKEQGSYYIPREFVNEMNKKIEGSYTGKGTYRVNVHQGGRVRGQEMHDMLREDFRKDRVKGQFFEDPRYQGKYRDTVNQWRTAERDLSRAQSTWQQTVAKDRNALSQFNANIGRSKLQLSNSLKSAAIDRDKGVGIATNRRQGQIDAAREAYQQRASARRQAYTNLAGMTGSAKAKGTQGQQNTEGQQ